jgi:NAD(P)-dependent dehydrogenase (short-subunit alcohol dehydrogenase family)
MSAPDRFLEGKVALVTGAAKRLGRAVAEAVAAHGAGVVIHYGRSRAEAAGLAEELKSAGGKAWTLSADLADGEQVERLVPRAVEQAGRLDMLVNSAAVFPADSLADARLETTIENLQVNAWAPFALTRAFARDARRGAVVNFLDTRVQGFDWNHVSYILSKHALLVLTRMTALEFAPDVRVNGVAPGLILPPPGQDESYLAKHGKTVPLRRHGTVADVTEAVLYLLRSEFVTGQVLFVDGGRHLMEYPSGSHPD